VAGEEKETHLAAATDPVLTKLWQVRMGDPPGSRHRQTLFSVDESLI
jgi:hypothetical protein